MANDLGAKRFIAVKLGRFGESTQEQHARAMRFHPCRNVFPVQASMSARTVQMTAGLTLFQPLQIRDRKPKKTNRPEAEIGGTRLFY